MNPKRIAIRFADNDFYNTVVPFLEIIKEQGIDSYGDVTKNKIVELFNRSAAGLYWLYQNKLKYQTDWDAKEYLDIEEKDVYFDGEIDAYIAKCEGWDNSEFFVLDTQVFKPYVYVI